MKTLKHYEVEFIKNRILHNDANNIALDSDVELYNLVFNIRYVIRREQNGMYDYVAFKTVEELEEYRDLAVDAEDGSVCYDFIKIDEWDYTRNDFALIY